MKLKVIVTLLLFLNNPILLPAQKESEKQQPTALECIMMGLKVTKTRNELDAILYSSIVRLSEKANKKEEYKKKLDDLLQKMRQEKNDILRRDDDEQEKVQSIVNHDTEFTKSLIKLLIELQRDYTGNDYTDFEDILFGQILACKETHGQENCVLS